MDGGVMSTNGAVFFLGNRAHYQVLDIPDTNDSNSTANGNQEIVNNIPTIHGNHSTKNINNYSYNDFLVQPSTSTQPSPNTNYNNETNNVVLNHATNAAYYANTPSNNSNTFSYTEDFKCKTRNCNDAIINIDEELGFLGNGVKHRSKKYGACNGSSEFILNDNDDLCNLNPSDLNGLDKDINKNKLPKRSRTFTASALLRALMARRRRRPEPEPLPPSPEPYVNLDHMTCTYRDSCRCLDCQSRYFECNDDDDDDDDFIIANYSANDYNESHQYNEASSNFYDESNNPYYGLNSYNDGSNSHYDGSNGQNDGLNSYHDGSNGLHDGPSGQYDLASVSDESVSDCQDRDLEAGCYEEYLEESDDEEVFIATSATTATSSTDLLIIQPPKDSNPQSSSMATAEEKLELELAAGAPVFFDHLLNHPFSCCIQ